jgi:hypothetical protein
MVIAFQSRLEFAEVGSAASFASAGRSVVVGTVGFLAGEDARPSYRAVDGGGSRVFRLAGIHEEVPIGCCR